MGAAQEAWSVPVRHPGTGRLIWASRLPFGYLEAPRLFCALTEALMQRLRVRAAGLGISFYVFVDDVLVVGDDESLTARICQMVEEEFAERGVWRLYTSDAADDLRGADLGGGRTVRQKCPFVTWTHRRCYGR